jgi:hypothetical protein
MSDPVFWTAAGAGLATIANVTLTSFVRFRQVRDRALFTKKSAAEMLTDKALTEALMMRIDILSNALERARLNSVESTAAIERVEAELGIGGASGPSASSR